MVACVAMVVFSYVYLLVYLLQYGKSQFVYVVLSMVHSTNATAGNVMIL